MYQARDIKPIRGFFGKGESAKEQVRSATGTDTASLVVKIKKVTAVN